MWCQPATAWANHVGGFQVVEGMGKAGMRNIISHGGPHSPEVMVHMQAPSAFNPANTGDTTEPAGS